MLTHRLRRWPNIGQTLGRCVVFSGLCHKSLSYKAQELEMPDGLVGVLVVDLMCGILHTNFKGF